MPSLLDDKGYFPDIEGMPALLEQAKLDEVEREFRAQIERVMATGLEPCAHRVCRSTMGEVFELERDHEHRIPQASAGSRGDFPRQTVIFAVT